MHEKKKMESRGQQILQQTHQAHITLQPDGTARVTGFTITTRPPLSASTSLAGGDKKVGGIGSYPVMKNGSPIQNKYIKVEPVETKKELDASSTNAFIVGGDVKSED